jgi:hypothetical protein
MKAPVLISQLALLVVVTPFRVNLASAHRLPSVVKHVFFERETDPARSEDVANLDPAEETGVVGGVEGQSVSETVGEGSDVTAILVNVASGVNGAVPPRSVKFRYWCWCRSSVLGPGVDLGCDR